MTTTFSPGLEGVIAGETAISSVAEGLRYRGYAVTELAEKCCFEEVAFLLLYGELPSKIPLAEFKKRLAEQTLPPLVGDVLRKLPAGAVPMDVLRSGVSLLAHFDPDLEDSSRAANLRKAERLLGQIPLIIGEFYRASQKLPATVPPTNLGFAVAPSLPGQRHQAQ